MESSVSLHTVGLDEVRKNWIWYSVLGLLLISLGTFAVGRSCLATVTSVRIFGWLMIFAGVSQSVHAFWKERGWSGFFIDLLMGVLYVVAGFMLVANPAATAVSLTLIITMFLIFDGIFRIAAAIAVRNPNWVWVLLSGVVTTALGIMIWRQWPYSGLWVIGLFVGIQMILNGWSLMMLGLTARSLPEEDLAVPAPSS